VVTVGSSTVTVGATMMIAGQGWVPGESVQITVHSTPVDLGTFTADSTGTIPGLSFVVPSDFERGTHTVQAVGSITGLRTTEFTVVAPTTVTAPTGGSVPEGSPLILLIPLLGVALGACGLRRSRV